MSSGAGTIHALLVRVARLRLVAHTVAAEHGRAAPEVCVGAHLRAGAGARGLDLGAHERAAAAAAGATFRASVFAHVLALGEAAGRQADFARLRHGPVGVMWWSAATQLARGRISALDAVIGEIAELAGRAGSVGFAEAARARLTCGLRDGDQRERRQQQPLVCHHLRFVSVCRVDGWHLGRLGRFVASCPALYRIRPYLLIGTAACSTVQCSTVEDRYHNYTDISTDMVYPDR